MAATKRNLRVPTGITIIAIDNEGIVCDMRIAVMVLDGMFDTGLSSVLDTLTMANELAPLQGKRPPFVIEVVSVRKRVRTALGMEIPTVRFDADQGFDWMLVPALGSKTPETLDAALKRPDVRDASAALVKASKAGQAAAAHGHLRSGRDGHVSRACRNDYPVALRRLPGAFSCGHARRNQNGRGRRPLPDRGRRAQHVDPALTWSGSTARRCNS